MKRLIICLLFALLLTVPASAHPGGTDSSGGHYDHDTGEYHYHHGYPAHQHEDLDGDGDLDCPHNFDDQTGQNSGSSSSSLPSSNSSAFDSKAPSESQTVKPKKSEFSILEVICFAIAILYIGWLAIAFISCGVYSLWEKISKWFNGSPRPVSNFREARRESLPEAESWKPPPQRIPGSRPGTPSLSAPSPPPKPKPLDDRGRLEQFILKNSSASFGMNAPPELHMAEDGTLYWGTRTEEKPFGDATVYITGRSGRSWHLTCGCRGAKKPMFAPSAMLRYEPCRICVPHDQWDSEVSSWYRNFLSLYHRAYKRD